MRVALIFPPYSHKVFSENLSTVDEEFCVAPPIILAYIAAILEQHGHEVMLLDARALNLTKDGALKQIKSFRPDILGFRAETYHFHDALEWIRFLKKNLRVPVITGGVNLDLYPEETLSHNEIDYGVASNSIISLPKLLTALEQDEDISKISGIIFKRENRIIINKTNSKPLDFDLYPFPARHLLPNDKYYSFVSQRKNFTIMLTSMGCPYGCTFCAIPSRYQKRSVENVIKEIEVCYYDFGIREIDFFDAVFFLGRTRTLELLGEIKKRKLDLEWSCRSRVDLVNKDVLKSAAEAGCRQIYYGIESISPQVLTSINKKIDPVKINNAIKLTRKYGIRSMGFFMVGNQGDTFDSVRETIKFAKSLDLDFVQVCRTIAKPGTDLDKNMIEVTGKDYWRDHVRGSKIEERLPTPWSTLSEQEKESMTKEFYMKFYFRPKIVWSRVSQIKSFEEFMRYVNVGFKMLLQTSEVSSMLLTDTSKSELFLAGSQDYLSEAQSLKVTIVIPTYNEKENLEGLISKINEMLPQAHIVIVDDNSPDGTGEIANQLSRQNGHIHVLHRTGKRGLGLAYKDGFKFVLRNLDSDYIFEMDADFSHNPLYLPTFLHYARSYDVVTGSRFLERVSIKNRTLFRNFISKSTKLFINIITGMNLTDVTTGYKCFRRKFLERIDFNQIKSIGFAFQIEMAYLSRKIGSTIHEIPIYFVERSKGKSKMSAQIMIEGIFLIGKLIKERLKQKRKFFK